MSLKDYDAMIDLIEQNIEDDTREITNVVAQMLGVTERDAGTFFRMVSPEGKTLINYIKSRKMEHIKCTVSKSKCTWEEAAYRYGFSEYSTFYRSFKKYYSRKPDSFKIDDNYVMKEAEYLHVILRRTDESTLSPVRMEENSNMEKQERTLNSNMLEQYDDFLEIENCRELYGLDTFEIMALYKESIRSGVMLEQLCDIATDEIRIREQFIHDYGMENESEEVVDRARKELEAGTGLSMHVDHGFIFQFVD